MVEERPRAADAPEHGMYSVANLITVVRLLLIPIFLSLLLSRADKSDLIAFVVFSLAASTDWLDGMIARRTGTVTTVGKVIDPLVDRLLIASGVVGLYIVDRLPLWVVVVLVARDAYLLYGAYVLERYRMRMPVTYAGKITTAVLLTGFAALVLGWPSVHVGALGLRYAGELLIYAGLALSLGTAAQYTVRAKRMVDGAKAEGTAARGG
ncbi:MAG: CDP-alcohol phosphatidyltransferase family protein [Coriobacteriia bacterium]|nr:CDP-alcohol phosphatidyltransferase family protein [Coriobacteriia bacterium]